MNATDIPPFLKLILTCAITSNNHKTTYSRQSLYYVLGFFLSFHFSLFHYGIIYFCFFLKSKTLLFLLALFLFSSFNHSTFLLIHANLFFFLFHPLSLLFLLAHMAKLGYDFYHKTNPLLTAPWHVPLKVQISAILGGKKEWRWKKQCSPMSLI